MTPPELVSGGVHLRDFLARFEPALAAADIACLLIDAPKEAADEAVAEIARPLNEIAQRRGIATLLSERATLAKQLGADGVHLDLRPLDAATALRVYRDARNAVGPDAIVGTLCPAERHLAMEVAELDADYVGFPLDGAEASDLLAWWAEVMNTPCVAFGDGDVEQARALAAKGADFVALPAALWSAADPAADVARVQAAIAPG
jgi:thiamine-phosphate pyrophosphorylase